jgi:hypothetical protein
MAVLGPARRVVIAAAAIWLAAGTGTRAHAQAAADATQIEANLKAVFLFNFAKYVTWPALAIGERSPAEIRICVPANDGFFALLRSAVEGENVNGKPLVAVALDGLDAARTCQILYVADPQTADGKAWLTAVRGRQVLTVADGTLTDDTVIAFVRDNNRIRFDINRANGTRRNLHVSSKLLRLARQVREQ